MDLLEIGPVNACEMAFKLLTKLCGKLLNHIVLLQEKSERKFLKLAERRKKPLSSRRKPHSACAVTSGYRMPRLHVSEEHRNIRIIHLWYHFRTAPDSIAYCSGQRTLQSFLCRRKAYPELRHPDIRIYPDTCKRSLTVQGTGSCRLWWAGGERFKLFL